MGVLFLSVLFNMDLKAQSASGKSMPMPGYTFPDDIADTAKKTFVTDFRKGHRIYLITCGSCHNKTVNGKEVIPDFSLPQLLDYEMRLYQEHGDTLTDRFVTDDEMQKVITFLRYKKPSGVLVRPGPKQDSTRVRNK